MKKTILEKVIFKSTALKKYIDDKISPFIVLDGKVNCDTQTWTGEREKISLIMQNGSASGTDTADAQRMPMGYRFDGTSDYILGDIDIENKEIKNFFSEIIVSLDTFAQNHSLLYRQFGGASSLYPRLYYTTATNTLNYQYDIDGNIKTLTIDSFSSLITKGKLFHILIHGDTRNGMRIYINGILRASDTEKGLQYGTSTSYFRIGNDSNLSSFLKGRIQFYALYLNKKITWNPKNIYLKRIAEGGMNHWDDRYNTWSGSISIPKTPPASIGDSPYVTSKSTYSVSGTAEYVAPFIGEEGYGKITLSTASALGWMFASISQSGERDEVQDATSTQKLIGVIEGETITVQGDLYMSDLSGNGELSLRVSFFTDAGTLVGSASYSYVTVQGTWQTKTIETTVPSTATHMNISIRLEGDASNIGAEARWKNIHIVE